MFMDLAKKLPFKVGQKAESKSFEEGYRGAWFRCLIKKISWKTGYGTFYLDFYDYPDDDPAETELYQKGPVRDNQSGDEGRMELMVRPHFPHICRTSRLPNKYLKHDLVVVINGTWKVGDLVDCKVNDCFWSGKITRLLGNDKAQIQFPEAPIGEGSSMDVMFDDLRPSLDWSPTHGWSVPVSGEHGESRYCARLIHPFNQGDNISKELNLDIVEDKPACVANMSESHEKENCAITEVAEPLTRINGYCTELQINDSGYWTSQVLHPQRIDLCIMELEELSNKLRWLREIVQFGFHMKASWKFLKSRQSNKMIGSCQEREKSTRHHRDRGAWKDLMGLRDSRARQIKSNVQSNNTVGEAF